MYQTLLYFYFKVWLGFVVSPVTTKHYNAHQFCGSGFNVDPDTAFLVKADPNPGF
jgi:hypothetical protein